MQFNRHAAMAAVALCLSPAAQATTITFDDMVGPNAYTLTSSYAANGYNFTSAPVRPDSFLFYGEEVREFGWSADPVGTTMTMNYANAIFTVARQDATTFDLASFDYADSFNDAYSPSVLFLTLNYANGTTSTRSYASDADIGLQSLMVNATGLSSFSIRSTSVQFDNFVVNAAAGAVPEPGSWLMLIAGAGMVGGSLRLRRKADRRTAAFG